MGNVVLRVVTLLAALQLGCDQSADIAGAVQKGPFVLGSSITVSTVDGVANPTGRVFPTSTTDDLGDFDIRLSYHGFVVIEGNGFYYNEVTGKLSSAPLTLRALYDVVGGSTQHAYVNIITHLTFDRVKQLSRSSSLPLGAATAQAEAELRAGLGIGGAGFDPHTPGVHMSIAGGDDDANAYLFAVSAILAQIASDTANGASVDATLQELLNMLSSSFAESGQIDPGFVQQIVDVQKNVDPQTIMNLLQDRLTSIHSSASVPDLNRVWDSDGNGVPNVVDHACSIHFHDGGDGKCVADGSCSPGYHDGGNGACVAAGTCDAGFQDGGEGTCQPAGTCSAGYHDGGTGACVPVGSCTVGHDGGDGVCVATGSCSVGYLLCGSACRGSRFRAGSTYLLGTTPNGVASGNFDGDAKLDLAETNGNSNDVRVLLGNGDGSFKPAVSYPTGDPPASGPGPIAVGDFNGDTKTDIAFVDIAAINVRVMLGNGDGTFQAGVSSPTPANLQQYAMVAAELNGDAKLDVVLVSPDGGGITVLLGKGDGTFAAGVAYPTGKQPWRLVAADFNGDHIVDIAATNQGDNTVSILIGNGNGTFNAAVNYGTGSYPTGVAAGDFDGDGKTDLAVADYNNQSAGTISVFRGNGDGTLQPRVSYAVGNGPWPLVAGDFNGDAALDLMTENFGSGTVTFLYGRGDGTFRPAVSSPVSIGGELLAADFNADSALDFAAVYSNGNSLTIYLNNSCAP